MLFENCVPCAESEKDLNFPETLFHARLYKNAPRTKVKFSFCAGSGIT